MLVLSRQRDESVVIPDVDLEVIVLDVVGSKVKLGFRCPDSLKVYRKEIWVAIQREQGGNSKTNLAAGR